METKLQEKLLETLEVKILATLKVRKTLVTMSPKTRGRLKALGYID